MKKILFGIAFLVSVLFSYSQDNDIAIYPNPCSDYVTVEMQGWKTLEIYDTKGSLVKNIDISSHTDKFTVNVSELENGMYVFVFKSDAYIQRKKVIKTKIRKKEKY